MGLLDKANDASSKPANKTVAKAVAKAKPVAKAKAVAKAKPAAKVISNEVMPAAVAANAKPLKAKREKTASAGLPDSFEIASPNARRIAWFTNFVVNLGPIFAFLFSVAILDAFTTIFAIVALAALIFNLVVIPIMSGRTLGNFISRTKNIRSNSTKPNFLHALLVNSTGIFALAGVIFLMIFAGKMFTETGSAQIVASVWSVLGLIFIVLYFVNSSMKRSSDMRQGLYDSIFGAYLVKHVPAEGEVSTGFIGKLENMSSYGDRYTKRQEEKLAKKATKNIADASDVQPSEVAAKKAETADDPKTAKKAVKKTAKKATKKAD
tara:strand:+ start:20520 stop:21485 length:966 start_codon:yes stop_codon:yes gene_type:complete